MDIKIKLIESGSSASEIEEFIEAYLKVFNESESLTLLSFTDIPITRDMILQWLEQSHETGVEHFIARDPQEQIIGIITVRYHIVEGAYIFSIAVDIGSRNQGVGKHLLDKAIQRAREKGFKAIDVSVYADNPIMLSLVIKKGFKPFKIEFHRRFDGEDLVYFKKYFQ